MQYLVSQCSNSIFHQHVTVKKKKKVSNPCWWSWLTTAKAELFNLNFLLCPMMSPWCNNVQISCCFPISALLPYRQYRCLRIWVLGPSCNTGMRRTGMFKLNSCLSIDSMQTCHFRPNRCDVSVVNWHCERVCECASVYFLHVWNEPLPSDCFQNKSTFSIKPEDMQTVNIFSV